MPDTASVDGPRRQAALLSHMPAALQPPGRGPAPHGVTGKLMLTATLTRPGTITAAGITLTSREPTLALCRALVDAGHADGPMTVVDSATGRPVMHVRSIPKAAMLRSTPAPTSRPAYYCRGRGSGGDWKMVKRSPRRPVMITVPPEELARRYLDGASLDDLGVLCGCTATRIRRILVA